MKRRVWIWMLGGTVSLALLSGVPAAAAQGQPNLDAVEALYCLGLLDGSGTQADGTPNFNLGGRMTRGEAITMVVRLTGGKTEAESHSYPHPFSDVADWGNPYVATPTLTASPAVLETEFLASSGKLLRQSI